MQPSQDVYVIELLNNMLTC